MAEGNYEEQTTIPPAQFLSVNAIAENPLTAYSSTGQMGIWRMRKIDQLADTVNNSNEHYWGTRFTKWFQIGTYEQPKKLRRIRMTYKSKYPVKVTVFKDYEGQGDSNVDISVGTLTFPQSTGYSVGGKVVYRRKMEYQRLFTRARSLQLKIETTLGLNNFCLIYGIEIEVDD